LLRLLDFEFADAIGTVCWSCFLEELVECLADAASVASLDEETSIMPAELATAEKMSCIDLIIDSDPPLLVSDDFFVVLAEDSLLRRSFFFFFLPPFEEVVPSENEPLFCFVVVVCGGAFFDPPPPDEVDDEEDESIFELSKLKNDGLVDLQSLLL
jgi:hypothetical protein